MRRDQILAGFDKVRMALTSTGIDKLFQNISRSGPEFVQQLKTAGAGSGGNITTVLEMYASYTLFYTNFSDIEKEIISKFELDHLSNSSFWGFIFNESDNFSQLIHTNRNITVFLAASERFTKLLERKSDVEPIILEEKIRGNANTSQELIRLKIIIRDADNFELSLNHLKEILSSIENLYNVIARAEGIKYEEILIGSMDSGSDKSFDIIGIAVAINKLQSFILECWDRKRFGKAHAAERSFKTASEGLSVINQIRQNVEKGSISAEEGEHLKITMIRSIDSLFDNGVYIPAMETITPVRPSELPIERKILINYQPDAEEPKSVEKRRIQQPRQTRSVQSTKRRAKKPATKSNTNDK